MTLIKVPVEKHSDTGASGAHRWMKCLGSINLAKKMGKKVRPAGMDAAMGTAAHTLGALCLENKEEPWEHLGVEIEVEGRYKFEVDEEMSNNVQMYTDFVWGLMDKYADKNPILHIEREMQSDLHKDAFGKADVTIEVPNERLIIVDYKNGMIVCEPTGEQTKYYGRLVMEHMESAAVKIISTYIVQPRAAHRKGPIRKAHYNPEELITWFNDEVLVAIEATKKKNAHLEIGEHCRFCPARDACPAIMSELMHFNLDVSPVYLTDEELSLQMRRYQAVAQYGEKYLKTETYTRVRAGSKIKGWKLVEKTGNRVFKNGAEKAAIKKWGDDAFDKKAKSPAQLEKLQGGKDFAAKWAYKPKTGYTIAPLSDSRHEVKTLMDRQADEDLKA